MPQITSIQSLFSNPWCEFLAKEVDGGKDPFYCLRVSDYVCVVALDPEGRIPLVRQFRPAVEAWTLELPAGHVDPGEGPAESARRELMEEAGLEPLDLQPLGEFQFPDTGRLQNRMWCFGARATRPVPGWVEPAHELQSVRMTPQELSREVDSGGFNHSLHVAALFLAQRKGFLF